MLTGAVLVISTLSLVADDLRIIGHSINWQLNPSIENQPTIDLAEQHRQVLRILLNELAAQQRFCQFNPPNKVDLEISDNYKCIDGFISLPTIYYDLMKNSVAFFVACLRHSPSELEIITGLPESCSLNLLIRMQKLARGNNVDI